MIRDIPRRGIAAVTATALILTAAASSAFEPDETIISDIFDNLIDPEVDQAGRRIVWQDFADEMWIAEIDPVTGDILPRNGRGLRLDSDLTPFTRTLNGPEWAYGNGGQAHVVYSRRNGAADALGLATPLGPGNWSVEILADSDDRLRPLGTGPGNDGPPRAAYLVDPPGGSAALGWRNVLDPASELTLDVQSEGVRWIEGDNAFVTTFRQGGERQVWRIDGATGATQQLTTGDEEKYFPFMWDAPDLRERVFMTVIGADEIGIFREVDGAWTQFNTLTIPSDRIFFHSPEPFVLNGRSYIVTVAAEEIGESGPFPYQPIGPTEIWILGVDPQRPFARQIDLPDVDTSLRDPEIFVTTEGAVAYFTTRFEPTGRWVLKRAPTGLFPEYGYANPAHGGAWSSLYRGPRNCACTPFEIAADYTLARGDQRIVPAAQQVQATLGPQRLAFVPALLGAQQARVLAVDTQTGEVAFRLDGSDVGGSLPGGTSLVDEEGNWFFASATALTRFDAQGTRQWQVPLAGLARGPQFSADGASVVLFTWNGWGYVIDAALGTVRSARNLWPGREFPDSFQCLATGALRECAYLHPPAVDRASGRIYVQANLLRGESEIQAFEIDPATGELVEAPGFTAPRLAGASAGVALSADGARLYTHTRGGELVAIDSAAGTVLWRFALAFPGERPPVLTDGGYLLALAPGNPVGLVRDAGTQGEWVFRTAQFLASTAAGAAGAGDTFVTVARRAADGAAVLLAVDPGPGLRVLSGFGQGAEGIAGLMLREDGMVVVQTAGSKPLRRFTPVR